ERRRRLAGTVVFMFQPAEEGGAGALRMIEAGVLDQPPVDAAFALHVAPYGQVGTVAASPGAVKAGGCRFHIVVQGRGGHAARPRRAETTCTCPGAEYPPVVNDPAMTDLVMAAAREVVGDEQAFPAEPQMVSEDFGYVLQRKPGCNFNLGVRNEERGLTWPVHHPRFDMDEA